MRIVKDPKTQDSNIIYALHYKGKLLGTFQWSDFGGTAQGLYGWRPPKKVYFKLGLARSGVSHLPKEIIDDIEIVLYKPAEVIIECAGEDKEKRDLENKIRKDRKVLQILDGFIESARKLQNFGTMNDYIESKGKVLKEIEQMEKRLGELNKE